MSQDGDQPQLFCSSPLVTPNKDQVAADLVLSPIPLVSAPQQILNLQLQTVSI